MERVPTPDPVAEAAEYQRYLTGLVGDDDPAEVQAGSAEAWREVIRVPAPASPNAPSPTSGPCSSAWATSRTPRSSSRAGTAGSSPRTSRRSSATTRTCGSTDSTTTRTTRRCCWRRSRPSGGRTSLWARSTGQERARVGLHTERGPESFDLTFNLAAGHDRFHLDQARRALAALG